MNLRSLKPISRSLLYEINITNFFNKGLIFTPKVFILCTKRKPLFSEWVQTGKNCAVNAHWSGLGLELLRFFGRAHFALLKRKKPFISAIFRSNKWTSEKVKVNSKYHLENQRTCNILIIPSRQFHVQSWQKKH